jgi:hypothetical protein
MKFLPLFIRRWLGIQQKRNDKERLRRKRNVQKNYGKTISCGLQADLRHR